MKNKILKNGEAWLDTAGHPIHAHGGHIVKFGDTYYWYGEDRRDTVYVSGYSSKDLMNWEFRGHLLTTDSPTENIFGYDCSLTKDGHKINIERPKIVYEPRSQKYVLWAHYENGSDYLSAGIAIATCDKPDGEFVYQGHFRPFGYMSRDCNLFQHLGKTYFVSSSNDNADLHVYSLTDDLLSVRKCENVLFKGQKREAPAFFTYKDKIYLITSQCTGWRPNQCGYSMADAMEADWESIKPLGDETTFHSQSSSVLTLTVNGETQYIYIGDRWGGSQWDGQESATFRYQNSSYYFALLHISEDSSLRLEPCNEFTIDLNGHGFEILS